MVNFNPSRDWILLPSPRQEKTESGIYVPAGVQAEQSKQITKVIKAGPDSGYKEGQIVVLHQDASWMPLELDGVEYALVNMYAIVGTRD